MNKRTLLPVQQFRHLKNPNKKLKIFKLKYENFLFYKSKERGINYE